MEEKSIAVWDESYVRMMGTLRRYVAQLQTVIPIDSLGRVTALINPQAILATGFALPIDEFVDSPPKEAVLPVSYLEGLPTIYGSPIWERLEGEKLEYYDIFKRYRSMRDAKTQRAVYKLALEVGTEVKHLEMLRQIYQWNTRVQAYDSYLAQERSIQLELRRIEIEGKHAKTAGDLFTLSATYLSDHPELLTPRIALQMLEVATKLERISAGLAPDNRLTASGADRTAITIQNNVGEMSKQQQSGTLVTGNNSVDKERLTQVLNIMNNIGLLSEQNKNIIEVEVGDIPVE